MKTNPLTVIATEALSFLFILYYGYTGFAKLWDYRLFSTLSSFQPYLNQLPVAARWIYPCCELLLAALFIFTFARRLAFVLAAVSLCAILVYRLFLYNKGYHLPCICGPLLRKLNENQHVVLNGVLLAGALTGAVFTRIKTKSPFI
jgi:hypothetical protein